MNPTNPDESILVMLARLEGKLDTALAQHGEKLTSHDAAINALQADVHTLEARPVFDRNAVQDHEARLRAQDVRLASVEAKPTITPKQLLATAGAVVTFLVGVVALLGPFLDRLYGG